ncbi:MAG: hypothetical protein GYB64_11285 [Chloroflexi bacterium]|nr:hypothetical protein [Chloroflexota bacterium]
MKTIRVKNFQPSRDGFQFTNRFPGFPLPPALEKFINVANSVHGLCGGMCYTVIDHYRAGAEVPKVDDVPEPDTPLYNHLKERQFASWGLLNTRVLHYVRWMLYSNGKAQADTLSSWQVVRKRLESDELTVLGLVYNDIRESLRVWDNHQVLAHGYAEHDSGRIDIAVYDPNYPRRDDVVIRAKPVTVTRRSGEQVPGLECQQLLGTKKVHDVHGFLVVPYRPAPPLK